MANWELQLLRHLYRAPTDGTGACSQSWSRPRSSVKRIPTDNLYAILGVKPACSFRALKQAYYRRAKECHPDRFRGDLAKEEEFKQVVNAFDVLSDPPKRQEYDETLRSKSPPVEAAAFAQSSDSILDTVADDILEELIVGNSIPRDTTLQRLMLDLTNTDRFVTFREAKNLFYRGRCREARALLKRLLLWSPSNILYHYYMGETAAKLGRYGQARRHLRICLRLGLVRSPPQCLPRIRRRLEQLCRRQGRLGKLFALLTPPEPQRLTSPAEKSRAQLDRTVSRMLSKQSRLKRKGKRKRLKK